MLAASSRCVRRPAVDSSRCRLPARGTAFEAAGVQQEQLELRAWSSLVVGHCMRNVDTGSSEQPWPAPDGESLLTAVGRCVSSLRPAAAAVHVTAGAAQRACAACKLLRLRRCLHG